MNRGQGMDELFALVGEQKIHLSAVVFCSDPFDQASFSQPIYKTDGAVVLEVEAFSELADRDKVSVRRALKYEQRLMLLCGKPRFSRGLRTEIKKTAKSFTEGS